MTPKRTGRSRLTALVIAVWTLPYCFAVTYSKMGPNECYRETCKPGQYCSDAEVNKRCMNCTHLTAWCPDVEKLESDFPQCAYICDLKNAKEEIQSLRAEVDKVVEQRLGLQQTLDQVNRTAVNDERELQKQKKKIEDVNKALTSALDGQANLKRQTEAERNKSRVCEQKQKESNTEREKIIIQLEDTQRQLKEAENANSVLQVVLGVAVPVLVLSLLIVSVCLCCRLREDRMWKKQINSNGKALSTATSSSGSAIRKLLCPWRLVGKCCMPNFRGRYVAQPNTKDPNSSHPMLPKTAKPTSDRTKPSQFIAQPDPNDPPPSQVMPTIGIATVTVPPKTDGSSSSNDSGSASNGSPSSSSSSGLHLVAPTGNRTEHGEHDAKDFMSAVPGGEDFV